MVSNHPQSAASVVAVNQAIYFFTARCYAERGYATVLLSVCPFVRDVEVPWSHRLEFFENNFMAEYLKAYARADPNAGDLVQREHP